MKITVFILILFTNYCVFSKEKRIKIGIIDTGISFSQATSEYLCENGRKTVFKLDAGIDRNGHGTNVFGLISKRINPKTHCIISYKFWKPSSSGFISNVNVQKALYQARKDGVKYINMSLIGPSSDRKELEQIKLGIEKGITYIVSAGNNRANLDIKCNYFPACYKKNQFKNNDNFIVVGAKNVYSSNYGKIVTAYEDGYKVGKPALTGTSQATAIYTGKLVSKK